MSPIETLNGHTEPATQAAPVVRFGPAGHQTLTVEAATAMLTDMAATAPALFGKFLARGLTGTTPQGGRD